MLSRMHIRHHVVCCIHNHVTGCEVALVLPYSNFDIVSDLFVCFSNSICCVDDDLLIQEINY